MEKESIHCIIYHFNFNNAEIHFLLFFILISLMGDWSGKLLKLVEFQQNLKMQQLTTINLYVIKTCF